MGGIGAWWMVVGGETIAADVGRVNVYECVKALGKWRESNSLLRCGYAVVEDGYREDGEEVMLKWAEMETETILLWVFVEIFFMYVCRV